MSDFVDCVLQEPLTEHTSVCVVDILPETLFLVEYSVLAVVTGRPRIDKYELTPNSRWNIDIATRTTLNWLP